MIYEFFGYIIRNILITLGPIFVKFGQVLSYDYPILKDLYILQNDCGPLPSLYFDYIKKKYTEFDFEEEYISSGSIAVVYKATNKDKVLAIKVKRPNIKKILNNNIYFCKIIIKIINIINIFPFLNVEHKINTLLKLFSIQCDFKNEFNNWKIFYEANKNIKNIILPKMYEQYCNDEILVMDYIIGKNISDIKLNITNKMKIFYAITGQFSSGIMKGVIHGDLHSGNYAIDKNNNIIIYDFGIVVKLNEQEHKTLVKLFNSVYEKNFDDITDLFIENFVEKNEEYYKKDFNLIKNSNKIRKLKELLFNNMDFQKAFLSIAKLVQEENLILNDKMQNFEFALLSYTNGISRLKVNESALDLFINTIDNLSDEILNL